MFTLHFYDSIKHLKIHNIYLKFYFVTHHGGILLCIQTYIIVLLHVLRAFVWFSKRK